MIHVFYSFGINPSPALYRFDAKEGVASFQAASFALPAMLAAGWPILPTELDRVRFHALVTEQLYEVHIPDRPGASPYVPRDKFLADVGAVAPEFQAAVEASLLRENAFTVAAGNPFLAQDVAYMILDRVKDDDHVVIEYTNGIRTIQTGLLLGANLLRALRPGVKLRALTYAELGGLPADGVPTEVVRRAFPAGTPERSVRVSPVYDLAPVTEMLDWAQSVNTFANYLDPRPLATRLAGVAPKSKSLEGPLSRRLVKLGAVLGTGWSRFAAADISELRLGEFVKDAAHPLAVHAANYLANRASALLARAVPNPDVLAPERLEFDLVLATAFREASRFDAAARTLRELCVNAVLIGLGDKHWLKRTAREPAEHLLNAVDSQAKLPEDDWVKFFRAFNSVGELRNRMSHGGHFEGGRATPESFGRTLADQTSILQQVLGLGILPVVTEDVAIRCRNLVSGLRSAPLRARREGN